MLSFFTTGHIAKNFHAILSYPLHHSSYPVVHTQRNIPNSTEHTGTTNEVSSVGAGVVWMGGGDACVALGGGQLNRKGQYSSMPAIKQHIDENH